MNKNKWKIAVIGCGMIAKSAHIPAYQYYENDFEVVAVCDTSIETAQEIAKAFGIGNYYNDAEAMLAEIHPNVVSVCVPNALHKQYVMLAMRYGAHVLCEKPLAMTLTDAKEMYDYANANGLYLIACQSWRFTPERFGAKRMIDRGELGKVYYAEISRIRRRGIPTWGNFHIKEHSGGGAFVDIGIHVLDAAVWLMGNPKPLSVRAHTFAVHTNEIGSPEDSGALSKNVEKSKHFKLEDMDVETFACGTVNFEGGFAMTFKVAWSANLKEENNIILSGECAGIDTEHAVVYRGETEQNVLETVPQPYEGKEFYGHFYIIENLAKVLRGEAELLIKPEETLTVTKIIEAVYRSAEEEREVLISEL